MSKKAKEAEPVVETASPKAMSLKEKQTKLRALIQKSNEAAGHKVLAFANEVANTYEVRRPCGIIEIDLATGGGLPAGSMNEISGPDNTGKTYLAMRYCLMHQRLYGDESFIAYAISEGQFDYRRAMHVGLKVSVPDELIAQWNQERVLRGMPEYTQEEYLFFKQKVGEFVIIRGNTGEELLQGVANALRSNIFGIAVIDSISAILPDADAEKELEEGNKMASNASLVTKFVQRTTPSFNGLDGLNWATLISINQVRANQERANAPSYMQKAIKQWASVGAYAARHAKHIDVQIQNGEKLKKTVKGAEKIIGKVIKFELSKGKTGAHDNVKGEFSFFYDEWVPAGVNEVEDLIVTGQRLGIIQEKAGKISVVQPDTNNAVVADIDGFPAFKQQLQDDFEFFLVVMREVLATKGIMCLFR